MALPVNLSVVTVTATYLKPDGSPETGTVTFTPSQSVYMKDADGPAIIVPETITAILDEDGSLSVALPATDDPDVAPLNFTYDVVEVLGTAGKFGQKYAIRLPAADTPIDLAALSPSSASGGTSSGPILLAINGKVPDNTGHLVLTAADLGALPDTYDPADQLDVSYVHPSTAFPFCGLLPGTTLTDVTPTALPAGITYDSGSDLYFISSGVYSNLHFTSPISVADNNIFMSNIKVEVTGHFTTPAVSFDPGSTFVASGWWMRRRVLEHFDISGECSEAISGAGFTARYGIAYDLHSDFLHIGRSIEPTVIEWVVAHDFNIGSGAHADGIQLFEAPLGLVRIANCWIAAENKQGRPYDTGDPDTGYGAALFVQCTAAIDEDNDLFPALRGRVEVEDSYFSSNESFNTIKISNLPNVPVHFNRNRIRRPLNANQAGTLGQWWSEDTAFWGQGNVDAATNLPLSSKQITGNPRRDSILSTVDPSLWRYGDICQPRPLIDCTDTLTLATGTAYIVVVPARELLHGHAVRCAVDTAGTVTECEIAVYRSTIPSKLQRVAAVSDSGLLTVGLVEAGLTLVDPAPELKFPFYSEADGSGDVVADEGDLVAYVITTTNSVSPKLVAHSAHSAAVLNRGLSIVTASAAISPGDLPDTINVQDSGTWTLGATLPWMALAKGYPEVPA